VPCQNVDWVDSTHIVCLTPPGEGRNKSVEVIVANQSAIAYLFNYFGMKERFGINHLFLLLYVSDVSILLVEPNYCSTEGGCNVALIGENFGIGEPAPVVTFADNVVLVITEDVCRVFVLYMC
jgi:IPT/TIG domain